MVGQPLPHLKSKQHERTATADETVRLWPGTQYMLTATKDEYIASSMQLSTVSNKEVDTITASMVLYNPATERIKDTIKPVELVAAVVDKVMAAPEADKVFELGQFNFGYKSCELDSAAKAVLNGLASYMAAHNTMRIEIKSHTDCRGGDQYNLKLSKERAKAVAKYLAMQGIAPDRMECIGAGMREPKVKCATCEACTEADHQRNRVLEFKIIGL